MSQYVIENSTLPLVFKSSILRTVSKYIFLCGGLNKTCPHRQFSSVLVRLADRSDTEGLQQDKESENKPRTIHVIDLFLSKFLSYL